MIKPTPVMLHAALDGWNNWPAGSAERLNIVPANGYTLEAWGRVWERMLTASGLLEALILARNRIVEERRALVECDTIPDENGWRDESTMCDLTKEAVAEIDRDLAAIDAVLAAGEQI